MILLGWLALKFGLRVGVWECGVYCVCWEEEVGERTGAMQAMSLVDHEL